MEINIPEIVAEVTEAFMRYEAALGSNDIDTIDTLFWDSPLTLRYGPNGTLLGHGAISAFRRARDIPGIERTLKNTIITTFGRDLAVANTESDRPNTRATGRQSQTWVRMPEGWRIISAHVSDYQDATPNFAKAVYEAAPHWPFSYRVAERQKVKARRTQKHETRQDRETAIEAASNVVPFGNGDGRGLAHAVLARQGLLPGHDDRPDAG